MGSGSLVKAKPLKLNSSGFVTCSGGSNAQFDQGMVRRFFVMFVGTDIPPKGARSFDRITGGRRLLPPLVGPFGPRLSLPTGGLVPKEELEWSSVEIDDPHRCGFSPPDSMFVHLGTA